MRPSCRFREHFSSQLDLNRADSGHDQPAEVRVLLGEAAEGKRARGICIFADSPGFSMKAWLLHGPVEQLLVHLPSLLARTLDVGVVWHVMVSVAVSTVARATRVRGEEYARVAVSAAVAVKGRGVRVGLKA
eukprot:CAMPEP_0181495446 /NCGR_PEP_ID=MMETSP1110-20121109/52381_1 /TAXON_ID=174948 /ORGANISM="Symbiodinium sp., Strain CCMP421" /LENGTH=131 /DNA_ID=CAMNT_0023623069 /DNA_START=10 /DNA_END=406 /DNA_ORIENTATION=-